MTHIDQIKKLVLAAAHSKREAAGFNGDHHDGGASRLEMQVEFYEMGEAGIMPKEWEQYEKTLDPEWNEYQRLKYKFESR